MKNKVKEKILDVVIGKDVIILNRVRIIKREFFKRNDGSRKIIFKVLKENF